MINGVKCRISLASLGGKKFYCDSCGKFFTERNDPPCGEKAYAYEEIKEAERMREKNKQAYDKLRVNSFHIIRGQENWKEVQ